MNVLSYIAIVFVKALTSLLYGYMMLRSYVRMGVYENGGAGIVVYGIMIVGFVCNLVF